MTGLTEIDSLEILVIVDNEVDPMSTYSNPAIQATGNIVHIGMRSPSEVHDRGDAAKELRMDSICCGAHGLSLMIVCYATTTWPQMSALINSLCHLRQP
jgi:7,8-dihydropterin-6-yl-methyl-4-(beta-D-ribofuranosyl)aminobenzene 5'-phosphate synthase